MENVKIITPYGDILSIRAFIEWEYNCGKTNFQPGERYPLWVTVPIEEKLGCIACSLFGDLASYDGYDSKIGVTDGQATRYFLFTKKGSDSEILKSLTAMLNVLYTSAEDMLRAESGYTFESLNLSQRLDVIARYIESNFEVCLIMLSRVPYMQWE